MKLRNIMLAGIILALTLLPIVLADNQTTIIVSQNNQTSIDATPNLILIIIAVLALIIGLLAKDVPLITFLCGIFIIFFSFTLFAIIFWAFPFIVMGIGIGMMILGVQRVARKRNA